MGLIHCNRTKALLVVPLLAIVCIYSHTTSAKNMALLVGVSKYPEIPGNDLTGPAPDVVLMRELLSHLGFDQSEIHAVADDVPGSRRPTREAILGEVHDLIAKASVGDNVVIYLSGHGSLQPAKPEDVGVHRSTGLI